MLQIASIHCCILIAENALLHEMTHTVNFHVINNYKLGTPQAVTQSQKKLAKQNHYSYYSSIILLAIVKHVDVLALVLLLTLH